MTFRLSPKIVDEVTRNLRAKTDQVCHAERAIMKICVIDCGMPRKEFLLLHELLAQPGRVLTRDKLQQVLYGWDEEVESNALEVHIHHLRRKLGNALIRTIRELGITAISCTPSYPAVLEQTIAANVAGILEA